MMWWIIIFGVVAAFAAGALLGARYLPVLGRDTDSLLDLCQLEPGQKLLDLGSGDGKLLKAAAKRGIFGEGWEINPFIFLISVANCWPQRRFIKLHLGNYWNIRLPQADAVYVFLIDRYMHRLDRKLQAEIAQPTAVVSYVFEIPDRVPVRSTKNSYCYHYPIRQID